MEECELEKCMTNDVATVLVYKHSDGAVETVYICQECAEDFSLQEGDDLPEDLG